MTEFEQVQRAIGFNNKQSANYLGISPSSVSNYKLGKEQPSKAIMIAMKVALRATNEGKSRTLELKEGVKTTSFNGFASWETYLAGLIVGKEYKENVDSFMLETKQEIDEVIANNESTFITHVLDMAYERINDAQLKEAYNFD